MHRLYGAERWICRDASLTAGPIRGWPGIHVNQGYDWAGEWGDPEHYPDVAAFRAAYGL